MVVGNQSSDSPLLLVPEFSGAFPQAMGGELDPRSAAETLDKISKLEPMCKFVQAQMFY